MRQKICNDGHVQKGFVGIKDTVNYRRNYETNCVRYFLAVLHFYKYKYFQVLPQKTRRATPSPAAVPGVPGPPVQ